MRHQQESRDDIVKKIVIYLDSHSQAILARADIHLSIGLEIKHFTIQKSKFGDTLYIQPPRHPKPKHQKKEEPWPSDIFFDKLVWKELTEAITEAYYRKIHQEESTITSEQVNNLFKDKST